MFLSQDEEPIGPKTTTLTVLAPRRILMPAVNLTSTDVNAATIRVPKLAVRHRTSEDDLVGEKTAPWESADHARPPLSSHSSERTISPTFVRRQSDQSHGSQDSLERLRQRGSTNRLARAPTNDQKPKKKKGSGMLGFLTLKEPSTSAWQEYAEAQKKAAAQKGSKSKTSSQKLPDFVPPTNSKWNGLPDGSKRSSTQSRNGSERLSTASTSTKQTSRSGLSHSSSKSDESGERSAAKRYGSLSSRPPQPQSIAPPPSTRGSIQSTPSAAETGTKPSHGSSLPGVHPALRNNNVTPWDEPSEHEEDASRGRLSREKAVGSWEGSTLEPPVEQPEPERSPQTFLHPPSPPPILPDPSSLLPLELPELPRLDDYDVTAITSPEQSPQTPPEDEQYHYLALGDQYTSGEEGGTFWHSDTDTEAEIFRVARPATAKLPPNFSRPRLARPASPLPHHRGLPSEPIMEEEDEDSDYLQPTLRDDKGRTSPFIFEQITPSAQSISDPLALPERTCSASSQLTDVTATTRTTITQALPSPTFSTSTAEAADETRPSTAASTVSTTTAHRPRSLSPTRSNSDAASVAPSEMSVQWTMSPKERLGLGGRVVRRENADVLPWEERGRPLSEGAAKRQSMASIGISESKLKRLSMRLGRKWE